MESEQAELNMMSLNIFVNDMGEFELSANRENDKDYSGRVIMTINQYD